MHRKDYIKIENYAAFMKESISESVVTLYRLGISMNHDSQQFSLTEYKKRIQQLADHSDAKKYRPIDDDVLMDEENPTIWGAPTVGTMRAYVGRLLQKEAGLELWNRESRNRSRFIFVRPGDRSKVTVQTYIAVPQKNSNGRAIRFSIHRLSDTTPKEYWYAFMADSFREPAFIRRDELQRRYENKQLKRQTSISISSKTIEKYGFSKRVNELRGAPDEETKIQSMIKDGDLYEDQ